MNGGLEKPCHLLQVFTGRLKYTQKHLGTNLLRYEVRVLWKPPSILSREIYYTGEWSLDFLLVKEVSYVAFFDQPFHNKLNHADFVIVSIYSTQYLPILV